MPFRSNRPAQENGRFWRPRSVGSLIVSHETRRAGGPSTKYKTAPQVSVGPLSVGLHLEAVFHFEFHNALTVAADEALLEVLRAEKVGRVAVCIPKLRTCQDGAARVARSGSYPAACVVHGESVGGVVIEVVLRR